jgi:hypothetical protein
VQLAVPTAMTDSVQATGGTCKRDWTTHRGERWGILAMNLPILRRAMAIARHVTGHASKRTFQPISGRLSNPSDQPEAANKVAASESKP